MTSETTSPALSPVDRRVLGALLDQRGRIASRDTLMRLAAVDSMTSRRIDVTIVALRKALGPDSIQTVRQRGWMLTPTGLHEAEKFVAGEVNMTP